MKPVDSTHEIEALHTAWKDALARADIDVVMHLLTADYSLWTPAAPPVTRKALRSPLTIAVQRYEITSEFERDELLTSGDLAFERGWDVQRLRTRATGETQVQRQYVFLVLQRSPDGTWRFARAMRQPGANA